jgi:phosphomannomutase
MTLIKSISGIRGTIGGKPGEGLTPIDIVKFTAAFGQLIKAKSGNSKVVIGRDARPSGEALSQLVTQTLIMSGFDVVDLGLSTTPTVEIAVPMENAGGGIILTASHNPVQWNALKLLDENGEFISAAAGMELLEIAESDNFTFSEVQSLGSYSATDKYIEVHIQQILKLPLVDKELIASKNFKVVVDAVNSTGGIAFPKLLNALGVKEIKKLYCEPNGDFPHNPEPLPEHLGEILGLMKEGHYDLGIVVDPDVDRLAMICENGDFFGEEYTLVAVSDYVLQNQSGNTVSNLSSSQALGDVTKKHGGEYFAAAVGEVNVVSKMKEVNAIIGGEGNGGVIYPELHYGRDALVGIALFLTNMAKLGKKASELRASYPNYIISKNKIELTPEIDVDMILKEVHKKYASNPVSTVDGVRISFPDQSEWIHLRKSNTESIIRVYAESGTAENAEELANMIISDIKEIASQKV